MKQLARTRAFVRLEIDRDRKESGGDRPTPEMMERWMKRLGEACAEDRALDVTELLPDDAEPGFDAAAHVRAARRDLLAAWRAEGKEVGYHDDLVASVGWIVGASGVGFDIARWSAMAIESYWAQMEREVDFALEDRAGTVPSA